jgi:dTDP-4-dehydrorhamnose reductase
MNILLTGGNGQVGFELQRTLAPLGTLHALDRTRCDLSNAEQLRRAIRDIAPRLMVNAAAYTAVDKAQTEQALAHAVNGAALAVIGEEVARLNAFVVHYSTDYVFDGTKHAPYTENDAPNPKSVYGASKLAGEQALRASGARHVILRTSWVVGAHGGNFAKTILRLAAEREELKVVADQHGAPTSAALIAEITARLVSHWQHDDAGFPCGLYHLAAAGTTTWHAYAQHVVRAAYNAGKSLRLRAESIVPITTEHYPLPAPRPANSRLDTTRLRSTFGVTLPDWREGLDTVLKAVL